VRFRYKGKGVRVSGVGFLVSGRSSRASGFWLGVSGSGFGA